MKLKELPLLHFGFRDIRLLAGSYTGADAFTRLVFLEEPSDTWCETDLLLLPETVQDGAQAQLEAFLTCSAAQRCCAAILTADPAPAPDALRDYRGIPIFAIGFPCTYNTVCDLLQAALQGNAAYTDSVLRHFRRDAMYGTQQNIPAEALLLLLQRYTGHSVFLFSDRYAFSAQEENADWDTARRTWECSTALHSNAWMLQEKERTLTFFPLSDPAEILASLCCVSRAALSRTDQMLFSLAQPLCALAVRKAVSSQRLLLQDREMFLRAIAAGTFEGMPSFLAETAEHLQLALVRPRILWLFEFDEASLALQIPLSSCLNNCMALLRWTCCSLKIDNMLAYLVECENPQKVCAEFSQQVLPALRSLCERTAGLTLWCGTSAEFQQLSELPCALDEAKLTLRIGRKMHPDRMLFFYDDYILYHLLDALKQAPAITAIYSEIIAKLAKFDTQNHAELLPTFLTLCSNNFNALQASDAMFLHRNSLYKRQEKIGSVLEMDFDSPDNKIVFQLAAKLYELFN